MSTLGDPFTDLGALLAFWSEDGDAEVLRAARIVRARHRAPRASRSRDEVIERYAAPDGLRRLRRRLVPGVRVLQARGGLPGHRRPRRRRRHGRLGLRRRAAARRAAGRRGPPPARPSTRQARQAPMSELFEPCDRIVTPAPLAGWREADACATARSSRTRSVPAARARREVARSATRSRSVDHAGSELRLSRARDPRRYFARVRSLPTPADGHGEALSASVRSSTSQRADGVRPGVVVPPGLGRGAGSTVVQRRRGPPCARLGHRSAPLDSVGVAAGAGRSLRSAPGANGGLTAYAGLTCDAAAAAARPDVVVGRRPHRPERSAAWLRRSRELRGHRCCAAARGHDAQGASRPAVMTSARRRRSTTEQRHRVSNWLREAAPRGVRRATSSRRS